MDAHVWRAAPADGAAGDLVDDFAVRTRLTALEAALEQLRRASAEPVGEHFGAFLNDALRALPTAADLPPDELRAESGPLAAPGCGTPNAHCAWSSTS
ncbi:hypothetical protein ABZ770_01620 [Streptomyces sp. NPDC006654]|uniref:hypothetical protein n=1 Tax=Streptomyces sp. NPDC006654 TaxID=3156897 RepID=UPI0033E08202